VKAGFRVIVVANAVIEELPGRRVTAIASRHPMSMLRPGKRNGK
jgi:hypothetical protein